MFREQAKIAAITAFVVLLGRPAALILTKSTIIHGMITTSICASSKMAVRAAKIGGIAYALGTFAASFGGFWATANLVGLNWSYLGGFLPAFAVNAFMIAKLK